jgi:hypothetical protein
MISRHLIEKAGTCEVYKSKDDTMVRVLRIAESQGYDIKSPELRTMEGSYPDAVMVLNHIKKPGNIAVITTLPDLEGDVQLHYPIFDNYDEVIIEEAVSDIFPTDAYPRMVPKHKT